MDETDETDATVEKVEQILNNVFSNEKKYIELYKQYLNSIINNINDRNNVVISNKKAVNKFTNDTTEIKKNVKKMNVINQYLSMNFMDSNLRLTETERLMKFLLEDTDGENNIKHCAGISGKDDIIKCLCDLKDDVIIINYIELFNWLLIDLNKVANDYHSKNKLDKNVYSQLTFTKPNTKQKELKEVLVKLLKCLICKQNNYILLELYESLKSEKDIPSVFSKLSKEIKLYKNELIPEIIKCDNFNSKIDVKTICDEYPNYNNLNSYISILINPDSNNVSFSNNNILKNIKIYKLKTNDNTIINQIYDCLKKQIILITCKCEMTLCIVCRYPDKHGCEYDFTTESNKKLTAENPKVISEKIDKI
jgi:hypothetical protein